MYGCFLTPPDNPEAHFGALFWHATGYSTTGGDGTIALGTWAVQSGTVPTNANGHTDVIIDVPADRVPVRAR
jgi:proline racemase